MTLSERIQDIVRKHITPNRMEVRRDVEAKARSLVQELIDQPTPDRLNALLNAADEDLNPLKGHRTQNRFGVAFRGANGKSLRTQLAEIVVWVRKLWEAPEAQVADLVDHFLREQPIRGAGRAFPTYILYLRNANAFNLWLPALEEGLKACPGSSPNSGGYGAYNAAILAFRETYNLEPQAVDVVLTLLSLENEQEQHGNGSVIPPGHKEPSSPSSFLELPEYFSEETFELLVGLEEDPTAIYYQSNKDALRIHVEEPIQRLLRGAVALLPPSMKERMETEKRIFGRILKNDFGQGGAWPYVWGALYPKGGKRTTDAQLFVFLDAEGLSFGFWVGESASDCRQRFLAKAPAQSAQLLGLIGSAGSIPGLRFGEGPKAHGNPSLNGTDWLADLKAHGIRAAVFLTSEEVLATEESALVQRIASTFQALYPLFQLAAEENPSLDLDPEDDLPEPAQPYPLEQFAVDTGLDAETLRRWVAATHRKGQAIFYGPPGTGKTYVAERMARHLVAEGDGIWELVQFHPAYAYEDFIQGIRPETSGGSLSYPLVAGRFMDFCNKASARTGTCVLILDEINRANLSHVFGELMYLLEYRDREIRLAAGRPFRIPGNVRLIGTMNTADRSIALVDHALRRRFAFLGLRPLYDVLLQFHEKRGFSAEGLVQVLRQVNAAIDDPHYEIGISYFMREFDVIGLEDIWRMEIEPYLEEQFFSQREKVEAFRWLSVKSTILAH